MITQNFAKEEFACKCGCGFDDIDIGLVNRLQVIRDIVQVPMVVLSGCRCPAHNAEVGGKEHSQHLLGKAADWVFPEDDGTLLRKVCENLLPEWSGGFKFYEEKKFCHLDVGPKRRW